MVPADSRVQETRRFQFPPVIAIYNKTRRLDREQNAEESHSFFLHCPAEYRPERAGGMELETPRVQINGQLRKKGKREKEKKKEKKEG